MRRIRVWPAGVVVAFSSSMAAGQTVNWIPPGGGAWLEPTNWSTGRIPTPAQNAFFNLNQANFYGVTLAAPATVGRLDLGRDRVTLDFAPGASLTTTLTPGVRIGQGLIANQSSFLNVFGGDLATGSVTVAPTSNTNATIKLLDDAHWTVAGTCTFGGAATIANGVDFTLDGASTFHVTGNMLLNGGGSFSPQWLHLHGAGNELVVDGSLLGGQGILQFDVTDGARVDVGGTLRVVGFTEAEMLVAEGPDTSVSAGALLIGHPFGTNPGGAFYGDVMLRDGATLEVTNDTRIGCSSVGIPAKLGVSGGSTATVGGSLFLGPTNNTESAQIDVENGSVAIGGALQCRTLGLSQYYMRFNGPVTLEGDVIVTTSETQSSVGMGPGGIFSTTGVTAGVETNFQCRGGLLVGNVTTSGAIIGGIDSSSVEWSFDLDGSWTQLPPARTVVQLLKKQVSNKVLVVLDATEPVHVTGLFRAMTQNSSWWTSRRYPIDVVRAPSITGAFTSFMIDPPVAGSRPLELVQTPTRIRLQIDWLEDFDDDGFVDGADLAYVLGEFGPGPSPADLDGDGVVNELDVAKVLANWNGLPPEDRGDRAGPSRAR